MIVNHATVGVSITGIHHSCLAPKQAVLGSASPDKKAILWVVVKPQTLSIETRLPSNDSAGHGSGDTASSFDVFEGLDVRHWAAAQEDVVLNLELGKVELQDTL